MHDLTAIRRQHLELEARKYALRLLGSLEKFVAGEGNIGKAQELIDRVYQRPHEMSQAPAVTGPTTYIPLTSRPADGLTVAGSEA